MLEKLFCAEHRIIERNACKRGDERGGNCVSVFGAKKFFKHINFLKGAGKFIFVFLIAGNFALITSYAN